MENPFNNKSTIYGPVKSWRFGMSLGIDPIFSESTCSFSCTYCQLGKIQNVTIQRKEYVSTEKVLNDFDDYTKNDLDFNCITFSGSGEPTLASNFKSIFQGLREKTNNKPFIILTNATTLSDPEVCETLLKFDRVILKIDALDDEHYQKINRPVDNLSISSIIKEIIRFRDIYSGSLEIQTMLMPTNINSFSNFKEVLDSIKPDAIHLNLPTRPFPLSWHRENRGNHNLVFNYKVQNLKQIVPEEYQKIIDQCKDFKCYIVQEKAN